MKKSLIALAVLAASGAAMAQSSVTMFGIVDTGVTYVNHANAAGDSLYGLTTSGNATSRLGFRGTEDLGGGLKAGFWLEGEIFGDNGNASGFNFQRRSTLSLAGNFGEVRLGRELVPTYSKASSYDLFGQTGIGQFMGWSNWIGSATADANDIRSSNMISYYTPNFGGFSGGVGYGFDEKTSGKEARYAGITGSYDNGPLSVTLAYDRRDLAGSVSRDTLSVGGSYDLNVVKLSTILQQSKYEAPGVADAKFNAYSLGASAPVGAGEFKLQYALYDQKAIDSKAHQLSLGYVHNLSKRTALYGTVAYLKNKDSSNLGLATKGLTVAGPGAGNNQTGVQVGIRHAF
ncbi:porin [Paracidovorax citrulli]|uniref:porin n=1 Tax=Paracidovorax citrulli TaxID=80869 RepID=UPI0002F45D87|nr:porin [Paracidovorax citrulli]QCX11447.1 Outer membrane porin protein 32 [Paracidovorax citrulli]UEG45583.1 porin [Paracidovorax citrulli]UMT87108.1 porin [Paracidovorax citrulli]UMT95152.1 porin [Paracidovorax citrulli]WIY34044.1 porin [Paracidovorax citrulli]